MVPFLLQISVLDADQAGLGDRRHALPRAHSSAARIIHCARLAEMRARACMHIAHTCMYKCTLYIHMHAVMQQHYDTVDV